MPNKTPRLPPRRTIFRVISITVLALIVLFLATGFWVYRTSIKTFEVRRLSLPTRIYADYLPLKPGMPLAPDDLGEKLQRRGMAADRIHDSAFCTRCDGSIFHSYRRQGPRGGRNLAVVAQS